MFLNHKNIAKIPSRIIIAYLLIITFVYVYTHHIITNYSDVISDIPQVDVFGKYKCIIEFDGCEDQALDGWSVTRIIAFMVIGYANPHSHLNTLLAATLIQMWAYSWNRSGKHILDPVLTMIGYSIGSALCQGECCPNKNKKAYNSI